MRDELQTKTKQHGGAGTRRRAAHEHTLRVVSWNVNGIRARMPRIAELLRREQPDVVCLQETRCPFRHFPHQRLEQLGYNAQHSPGRMGGGVAILVRSDRRVSHRSLALAGRHELACGRWLETTCAGLTLGTVYAPAYAERREHHDAGKLEFLEAVANQACREHYHPLLIAGDFNVAPSDRDVYEATWLEGSSHTAASEREELRQIMREGELLDVYRHLHPDEDGYTCWDQRDGHYARDYGLRIDLALASSRLAEHIARCEVKHAYRQGKRPSNHAPLEIELRGLGECEECTESAIAA